MKLRKHQGNKFYKITWSQRTPHEPRRAVYTTGQNPTATLNAFLFGRDRTNITATITEWFPAACTVVSVPATPCIPCRRPGVRRPSSQMLAYVVTLSTSLGFGGAR